MDSHFYEFLAHDRIDAWRREARQASLAKRLRVARRRVKEAEAPLGHWQVGRALRRHRPFARPRRAAST